MTIRVFIADDDPAVRRVLTIFLADADDMTVIEEAGSGREAIEMIERFGPDVVLIDCRMADVDCLEVARLVEARGGDVGIVVLDTYGDRALEAAEAGASGHVLKDALRERLLEAIMGAATSSSDKPARDARKEAPDSTKRQTESE